jgi:hypothetical protein
MRRVILLNTSEFPCPGSHLLHTRKFLSSFAYHGFDLIEVRTTDQLIGCNPKFSDIVYVSDHGLAGLDQLSEPQLRSLEVLQRSGVFPIFWYWFKHVDLLKEFFRDRWILTGEHFLADTVLDSHRSAKEIFDSCEQYVPLSFAAAILPDEVGNNKRIEKYRAFFVGHRYKRLLNFQLKMMRNDIKVIYTPPFIDESERIDLFSSSRTALGWHSAGNIGNGVVVERVFEGLAFGNFVVSDNPYAERITDGIVKFANSLHEVLELVDRATKDQTYFETNQQKGLLFAREKGNYTSVSKKFIDRIG